MPTLDSPPLWGARTTAAGRLAESLSWQIITGRIAPGAVLTEVEVAAEAGLSRTPVREAMLQLERWGLVRLLPKKGAVVPELTAEDAEDLMALRALLEADALRATSGRPDRLADLVRALEENLAGQRAALERGELTEFSALDVAFHMWVIATGRNRAVDEVMQHFAPRFARIIHAVTRSDRARVALYLRGHERIAEHLAAGRTDAALAALREHLAPAEEADADTGVLTALRLPEEAGR